MNVDFLTAQKNVESALQALEIGDRLSARHYAEQAAALAPEMEQPWLLLAFLASPKAANYYLDRALQANPQSPRALAAKDWLKKQAAEGPAVGPSVEKKMERAPRVREIIGARMNSLRFLRIPAGIALLVLVLGIVFITQGKPLFFSGSQSSAEIPLSKTARPTGVVSAGGSSTPRQASTALPTLPPRVSKTAIASTLPSPTATHTIIPSETPTQVPSEAASPVPSATNSPVPSATATLAPTLTVAPTEKATSSPQPSPTRPKNTPVSNSTYTVGPGDTLNLIAQRFNVSLPNLIAVNNITNPSFIRAGQVLIIPGVGKALPATAAPTQSSSGGGASGNGKEILIDISEQHIYAYENSKLVFSFVASTGIGNSTRIGTFKVLDKIPRAYSNAFNIWMPYWMGIYYSGTLENGIHGLPLLMNGVELWGNLLGKPATYGCIEARTFEIKMLYDWAEIGTPVIIRR